MTKGFDAINEISEDGFKEMKKETRGYCKFIGRIGRTTGQVDSIGITNIVRAQKAGLDTDAYIFPKFWKPASSQVEAALNALPRGVSIGTVWIDVEPEPIYGNGYPTTRDTRRSVQRRIEGQEAQAHALLRRMPNLRSLLTHTMGNIDGLTYNDLPRFNLSLDVIRYVLPAFLDDPSCLDRMMEPHVVFLLRTILSRQLDAATSELRANRAECEEFLRSNTLEEDYRMLQSGRFEQEIANIFNNNREYIRQAVNKAAAMGYQVGIYTNKNHWAEIVGDWSGMSGYPLWYSHFRSEPNFSDFDSFGGWNYPTMKQYADNYNEDSDAAGTIDLNYY